MGERRAVLFAGCVAAGLYLAAFGLLSMGGILRSRGAVLVAVLLLTAAALLLQLTLSRARARRLVRAWVRWALPAGIVVIGGVAALLWWLGTRSGHLTGGVGLAGVCAAYLGAGQLLAEARADAAG
jgi:hypothetical protein